MREINYKKELRNRDRLDVPVLFIIFRRVDTAIRVMEAIARVRPKKLYISQDGPRNADERKKVLKTRKAVLSKIDWDCEVIKWFHNKNLGFINHIPKALEKFFKREEYGIYLEDDTLPNEDFFYYQREMLKKYKDDSRIFAINGTNLFSDKVKSKYSYFLSKISSCWGIGLWRRSFVLYKSDLFDREGSTVDRNYNDYFFNRKYKYYLTNFWKAIKQNRLNSWAMKIAHTAMINNMYFITPSANMVVNLGTGDNSTNPFLSSYDVQHQNLMQVEHPKKLKYETKRDKTYFDNLLKGGWIRLVCIHIYLFSPKWLKKIIEFFTSHVLKKIIKA